MDPELAAMVKVMPRLDLSDLATTRSVARAMIESQTPRGAAAVLAPGIEWSEETLSLADGREMPCRVYRPPSANGKSAALVFIHGGGFVAGSLDDEHLRCMRYAAGIGCVVIALTYRLAPEHPWPAAFEDCYQALDAVIARADQLGIDVGRVALGGISAGGALAAGIAQRARDLGGPALTMQLLLYPVLDDRLTTTSARRYTEAPWWDARHCEQMWDYYLGPERDGDRPYAAPGRTSDLGGLPQAHIVVAEHDALRDEALEYARRLNDAGVPVELHQYAGTFHGFDGLIGPEVSARAMAEQVAVVRAALHP
jgi:acetyl esterase/lipase